jgi:hypothetical protein
MRSAAATVATMFGSRKGVLPHVELSYGCAGVGSPAPARHRRPISFIIGG